MNELDCHQSTTNSTGCSAHSAKGKPTEMSDEEIRDSWLDACRANDDQISIPGHLKDQFRLMAGREGAKHGVRNEKNGQDRFHNQISCPDPTSGRTMVFNMETLTPISVSA